MISSLKSFFQEKVAPADQPDDANRLQVATCALLLETAHADDEFSDDERATILTLVAKRFHLSEDEANHLLHVADAERQRTGDLYQFAHLVNDSFSRERKFAVIELLWQVVYSDGVLEAHEDSLMHKMGKLLGIRNNELMALKANVKRDLGI